MRVKYKKENSSLCQNCSNVPLALCLLISSGFMKLAQVIVINVESINEKIVKSMILVLFICFFKRKLWTLLFFYLSILHL